MGETSAFIPKNKPKFWVIGILAGLSALFSTALSFGAVWLGIPIPIVKALLIPVFAICWATFAVSWVGFAIGMLSGRYRNLTEKPWREQEW